MINKIKALATNYFPEVIGIRNHLHAHPELSFEEKETSDFISAELTKKGIEHERNWGGHGIVVNLVNDPSFPTIALRADIDALPIQEENDVPYKSKNAGVMHACGHDVHSSSMLGTVFILNDLGKETGKNFKIIFQPAEEKLPGGASILIKEGVLENPKPATILGQHVHPILAAGKVGFRPGLYMASADEIYMTIRGKGGHAAIPHENIDTVLMASSIIVNLQQVVSRRSNPTIPTVLSFGKINSIGGATNIIPDEIKIEGTFRTMDEEWRAKANGIIEKLAREIAESMGGVCEIEIMKGYPCLINEVKSTEAARQAAQAYLGEENVVELPIRMTSEDFAFYTQKIPACFYRLGTGNVAKGITSSVHTPTFDIDEDSLRISSGLMAYIAINQ
ncbi:M20 metallopeptidase family protein [Portibacter lacus]|uniref:N-acyl-L-amino acid amidohydrolase n=1 Tax=Portibacter lacus TaxID=1099794 RepID=A0AA37WHH2_9BACT|nr:amidohydrolase [Portibacter lacus]GLR19364.1 N-acyl-L-amino acid amidohydrolase [Portibacter lacus]